MLVPHGFHVMMSIQAKITFTSLNDSIFPAKRVITLNSRLSKITVGRASKSSSKSLFSAGDNAWFDSPVMSRDHAEISLDSKCETLLLRDVGSMHGTSINNSQLVSYVPTSLCNGDVVIFGTEVKRGTETYPPCKFIVNYEISSQKTANTFAYPESSDFDDDDDISLGESDIEQNQVIGTVNDRNIKTIDSLLDSNHSPRISSNSNVAPISINEKVEGKVLESKKPATEKTTGGLEDIKKYRDLGKITPKSKEHTTSKSDDGRQSSLNPNSQNPIGLGILNVPKGITETQKLDTNKPTEKSTYSEASPRIAEAEAEASGDNIKNTTKPCNLANEPSINYYSSDGESDTQSEYRLSSCTDEELRVLLDDDLNSNHGSSLTFYNYDNHRDKKDKEQYNSSQCTAAESRLSPSITSTQYFMSSVTSSSRSVLSEHDDKCSIKSDENVLKNLTPQREKNLQTRVNRPSKSEETLEEERLRKLAFFKAREYNKAKFNLQANKDDRTSQNTPLKRQLPKQTCFKSPKALDEQSFVSTLIDNNQNDSPQKINGFNQYSLINISTPEDMKRDVNCGSSTDSSAVLNSGEEFTSKKAIKYQNENKLSVLSPTSNCNESGSLKCRKRKADELSGNSEDEVESCTIDSFFAPRDTINKNSAEAYHEKSTSYHSAPLSKRRKIMESLGYVALGSFAAAAGLFSVLVATAPEFS